MGILLFAFLIGCVCGLRSMTAPAVVAWGAHLGWLHLDGSWLAFLANKISLVVFSLFAVGELIADKLPFAERPCVSPAVQRSFPEQSWEDWAGSPALSQVTTTAAG
jgi:uncharacterized membrane protein